MGASGTFSGVELPGSEVVAFGLVVLVRVVRVVLLGVLALFHIGYQRLLGG